MTKHQKILSIDSFSTYESQSITAFKMFLIGFTPRWRFWKLCGNYPYKALKEFGRIPKSLFILKYRDDCLFRQSIEAQLNKVESSNKFSKAISFGHNQEFVQSEKEAQEIAESCRRLIKNAIVCWNYLYLSRELANKKNEVRKTELLAAIRNGSVVT